MVPWLAIALAAPPVVPDARFPFDLPEPLADDVPDRELTGTGCTEGTASFHPDAGDALTCGGTAGQGYDATVGTPVTLDGDLTLAAWIRPRGTCVSYGVTCVVAAQGNSGADVVAPFGFMFMTKIMFMTKNGNLALELQFDDGSEQTVEGGALAFDSWVWAVAIYQDDVVRLYLDRVLAHSDTIRSDENLGTGLRVGYVVARTYDYDGDLDELLVFDRALDHAEVQQLWDGYGDGDGDGQIMDADCDPLSPVPCDTGDTGPTGGWPDLAEPPAVGGGAADVALVVAIDDYWAVPDVPGATVNGNDWYRYLVEGRGLPPERVRLLRDQEATVEGMEQALADLSALPRDKGTAWVVFVGHGAVDPIGGSSRSSGRTSRGPPAA